jgi:hypothetical protein
MTIETQTLSEQITAVIYAGMPGWMKAIGSSEAFARETAAAVMEVLPTSAMPPEKIDRFAGFFAAHGEYGMAEEFRDSVTPLPPVTNDEAVYHLAWLMWCNQEGYHLPEDRAIITNWMREDAALLCREDEATRDTLVEQAREVLAALAVESLLGEAVRAARERDGDAVRALQDAPVVIDPSRHVVDPALHSPAFIDGWMLGYREAMNDLDAVPLLHSYDVTGDES